MADKQQYPSDIPTLHGKATMTKSDLKEQLNIGNDKAEKILNECSILGAFKIGGTWVIPVEGFVKMLRAGRDLPNHTLMVQYFGPRHSEKKKEVIKFLEIMGEDMNKFDLEGTIKKYEGILENV